MFLCSCPHIFWYICIVPLSCQATVSLSTWKNRATVCCCTSSKTEIPNAFFLATTQNSQEWDSSPTCVRCSVVANKLWPSGEIDLQQKYRPNMLSSCHFLNVEFRDFFNSCSISNLVYQTLHSNSWLLVVWNLENISWANFVVQHCYGLCRISLSPSFQRKNVANNWLTHYVSEKNFTNCYRSCENHTP